MLRSMSTTSHRQALMPPLTGGMGARADPFLASPDRNRAEHVLVILGIEVCHLGVLARFDF